MAGDWIPMRLDLAEDPAVLEMADILGEPEEYVVGCLHKIWSWASRQCHCGTVTGVTVMSLSRAVKLPKAVDAMVKVGWLIDGTGEDGRPFITFPKWENWLSKSAKARINNAINQRNSRSAKSTAVISDPKPEPKTVTGMSSKDSDKTVTTVQERTVEEKEFTHTLSPDDPNQLIGKDVLVPSYLREWFLKWLDWRWQDSGKKPPATLQQTWVHDLHSRGQDKAIADLRFSISKQAKNLLDSRNDFGSPQGQPGGQGAPRQFGKETNADKARKLLEQIKNGSV